MIATLRIRLKTQKRRAETPALAAAYEMTEIKPKISGETPDANSSV